MERSKLRHYKFGWAVPGQRADSLFVYTAPCRNGPAMSEKACDVLALVAEFL